jgi:hypothetical protein
MTQLEALLRTLAIELPVALACLFVLARASVRAPGWWRAPLVVVAASLVTHPFAWSGNLALLPVLRFWPRVAVVELCVCAAEAMLLRFGAAVPWPAAAITATVMNAASFGFGLWWMWRA